MTTLDQRILIPTPPNVVWDYISNIANNPQWQADCKSVTFLTSKKSGPGTRWRTTSDKGREQVIEITAWYDGLGYQYTYIDGMPFRESMGRIRLQEIPEGTVVQWTIQYEMGGLLAGVRGSLGATKQIENMMVASLKNLWKQVNTSGAAQNWRDAKSLMRDAPDAEARQQYKPRHPAVVDIRAEGSEAPPRPQAPIPEPPIAEDDTRPRPSVAHSSFAPPRKTIDQLVEDTEEPEFLADLTRFAPPPQDVGNDTQPIKTISPEQERAALAEKAPEAPDEVKPSIPVVPEIPAPDVEPDEVDDWFARAGKVEAEAQAKIDVSPQETASAEPETAVEAPPPTISRPADEAETRAVEKPDMPAEAAPTPIPGMGDTTKSMSPVPPALESGEIDTSKLSIWEIFGVPKPSETQQMRAIAAEEAAKAEAAPAPTAEPEEAQKPAPEPTPAPAPSLAPAPAPAPEPASPKVMEDSTTEILPMVYGRLSLDLSRELLMPRGRIGLRLRLRQKHVKLRRPK